MALNIGILILFFIMKQVRGSVYASYMIQIAITDVIICLTWLIFSSMNIHHTKVINEKHQQIKESSDIDSSYDDQPLIVLTTVYNLHFYINIFLLAAMSVERFFAVWKSLRCQRYKFNKKVTYAISCCMWLLAFVCVLPTFFDKDLVFGKQTRFESVPNDLNEFVNDVILKNGNERWNKFVKCTKLYTEALHWKKSHLLNNNSVYVESYQGVDVENCVNFLQESVFNSEINFYGEIYGGSTVLDTSIENKSNETSDYSFEDEDPTDFFISQDSRYSPGKKVQTIPIEFYHNLLDLAFPFVHQQDEDDGQDSICEPSYDKKSTIYNIAVQVVVGFFVPYIAIVVSYLAIARMIGKRARNRLQTDEHLFQNTTENYNTKSDITTRMSGFFRTLTLRSHNENHTSTLDKKREYRQNHKNNDNRMSMFIPVCPKEVQEPKDLVSLVSMNKLNVKKRPISNGSASSGESFLTDQTSLQVSPNMRLSQPLFNYCTIEGQKQVKRAISADSGTASIAATSLLEGETNNLQPAYTKQLSNEYLLFKPSNVDMRRQRKRRDTVELTTMNERNNENNKSLKNNHRISNETKQPQKNKSFKENYQSSKYLSGKTSAYKNAEKHLKIARTVTAYVIVFSLCWLPQRIHLVIYILQGMKGMEASTCHMISIVVRIVSFFSVLLNPIVYATTQKDINKYIHKNILTKLRRNLKLPRCFASTCIHKLPNNRLNSLRESKDKTRKPYTSPLLPTHASTTFNRTTADIRHQNKSSENTLVATDKFEQERKNKHFERRIWLASRLARSNTNEDGTINEESGSR